MSVTIRVHEKSRSLEMKRDTLLKLGIQLLYRCSYLLKIKNENRLVDSNGVGVPFKKNYVLHTYHGCVYILVDVTHKSEV